MPDKPRFTFSEVELLLLDSCRIKSEFSGIVIWMDMRRVNETVAIGSKKNITVNETEDRAATEFVGTEAQKLYATVENELDDWLMG